ncbi:MAG: AraC family transcriptional regulator [Lachnospiraceae bacterium]|nr:AraC family transcriptional regulator [Lachnospiraceae bacterium]
MKTLIKGLHIWNLPTVRMTFIITDTIQKCSNMNITEHVIIKRMEAAKNMLKYSDYSFSEIFDILHFSSYSHFARTFRKYFHTSPKKYRQERTTDICAHIVW